jgi:hypothetical protein
MGGRVCSAKAEQTFNPKNKFISRLNNDPNKKDLPNHTAFGLK